MLLVDNTCTLLLQLKREAYNPCIIPVATYRSETWSLRKFLERKLQIAQSERTMLDIIWRDKIREHTKVEDILTTIKRKKMDMGMIHNEAKK